MATPEERHTQIMVRLENLDTKIEERIIPATDQVWENEKEIMRIGGKVKIGQWIGGAVGLAFIGTLIRGTYAYMSKHW